MERIFLASVFSVCSSSTIVYKTFNELKLKQQRFASLVLSVLVIEDVLSIVIMVMLSAMQGAIRLALWSSLRSQQRLLSLLSYGLCGYLSCSYLLKKDKKDYDQRDFAGGFIGNVFLYGHILGASGL